jgi:hypothetical protein
MKSRWKWGAVVTVVVVAVAVTAVVLVRSGGGDGRPEVRPVTTQFRPAGALLGDKALATRAVTAWQGLPPKERLAWKTLPVDVVGLMWAGPRDGASEVLLTLEEGTVFRYRERPGQAGTIERLPDAADSTDESPIPLSGGGWLIAKAHQRRHFRVVRRDGQGAWSDPREMSVDRDGVLEAGDDAYLLGPAHASWLLRSGAATTLQIGETDMRDGNDEWRALAAAVASPDGARLAVGALDAALRALPGSEREMYYVSVLTTQPLGPIGPFAAIAVSHHERDLGTRVAAAYRTGTTTVLPGTRRASRRPGYGPILTGGWLTSPDGGAPLFIAVGERTITSITVGGQTVQGNVAPFPSVPPGSTPPVTGTAGGEQVSGMP